MSSVPAFLIFIFMHLPVPIFFSLKNYSAEKYAATLSQLQNINHFVIVDSGKTKIQFFK